MRNNFAKLFLILVIAHSIYVEEALTPVRIT